MITHLDLFSGIGGFALAIDQVYGKSKHIFVENDRFCQQVLKKHWPKAEYHGDIREFITNASTRNSHEGSISSQGSCKCTIERGETKTTSTYSGCSNGATPKTKRGVGDYQFQRRQNEVFILTGGFPCQPFSQAGRRKGTADDRYLWPSMLECITLFRPEWVIAENVSGIATWNEGVVFQTVCSDLEEAGYEVQPFRIPACAVGAPHRRDRWWFVAHRKSWKSRKQTEQEGGQDIGGGNSDASDTTDGRCGQSISKREKEGNISKTNKRNEWEQNWLEVATELCRVDDGLPRRLDRNPRLKALGNAIVPQVAYQIIKVIKDLALQ